MSGIADSYQFKLPRRGRPSDVVLSESWYPGIQRYWENCTTRRSVDPILGIKAVVIHATAGGSSAGAISVMKRRENRASFHWLVPDENEPQHGSLVWACAPEARAAWHVRPAVSHPDVNGGAKRVNQWSLGIEVVNTQVSDPFSAWQVLATAQIIRYCWAKYPNLEYIVSHAKLDPGRRSDPGSGFPWSRFKELVLDGGNDAVPAVALKAVLASKVKAVSSAPCCCG
ncbi:MAG TPA: N-acetylmuramoyl-L-alanine amidase [Blastocatellia bacterium]|nr:N-acetylmuramoyl-L-alanine amidase [Blastocatellia bacterium]